MMAHVWRHLNGKRQRNATLAGSPGQPKIAAGGKHAPGTVAEYTRILNKKVVPVLGERHVADIAFKHVEKLHISLKETPRDANNVVTVLKVFLGWCRRMGYRPTGLPSVTEGLEPKKDVRRLTWVTLRIMQHLHETRDEECPWVFPAETQSGHIENTVSGPGRFCSRPQTCRTSIGTTSATPMPTWPWRLESSRKSPRTSPVIRKRSARSASTR